MYSDSVFAILSAIRRDNPAFPPTRKQAEAAVQLASRLKGDYNYRKACARVALDVESSSAVRRVAYSAVFLSDDEQGRLMAIAFPALAEAIASSVGTDVPAWHVFNAAVEEGEVDTSEVATSP